MKAITALLTMAAIAVVLAFMADAKASRLSDALTAERIAREAAEVRAAELRANMDHLATLIAARETILQGISDELSTERAEARRISNALTQEERRCAGATIPDAFIRLQQQAADHRDGKAMPSTLPNITNTSAGTAGTGISMGGHHAPH